MNSSIDGSGAASSSQATSPTAVEPPVSSPSARARFEFEANGRGNEGSKVLMVEWEEDSTTRGISGVWAVHWDGMPGQKSTMQSEELDGPESVLGSQITTSGESREDKTVPKSRSAIHRRYFLIGPKRNVPTIVTITLQALDANAQAVVWRTNPLPAIFPKPLLVSEQGRLGVLHTRWATLRLASLDREIEAEAQLNCEGIALHIALSERERIIKIFGLGTSVNNPNISSEDATVEAGTASQQVASPTSTGNRSLGRLQIQPVSNSDVPNSPTSPRTPGGSRLAEKLKGLKLQTSDDVAVPLRPRMVEKLMTAENVPVATTPQTAKANASSSNMGSIGAMLAVDPLAGASAPARSNEEEEDELFALPLSPRSPEMTKSPFSFAAEDTQRYASIQKVS